MPNADRDLKDIDKTPSRRAALGKLGKYAAVSAPTVALLLAAKTKPTLAAPISGPPTP